VETLTSEKPSGCQLEPIKLLQAEESKRIITDGIEPRHGISFAIRDI
jgi:hypothetical protein